MTSRLSLLLALVPGLLQAQPAKPVTRIEAQLIVSRMDDILHDLYKGASNEKPVISGSQEKSVTRSEIIDSFYFLFTKAKSGFKFMPRLAKSDPKKFQLLNASAKSQGDTLVKWGFLAPVGPLLTDSKQEISITQFGDAVGYFLARLSELTHKPSSKYSPDLMTIPPVIEVPTPGKKKAG
ncbi:MAG: hypothetical protein K8R88_12725 [Armatimonadetes bacterium]|nr:hypothetical protein [Armatimonadota bacterium]